MNKFLIILIIIFLRTSELISQDFDFKWEISPFPVSSNPNSLRIIQKSNSRKIIIYKDCSKDSTVKKIKKADCDSLRDFLDRYKFTKKGSSIKNPVYKEYSKTKFLPDTNWIVINGDTIRKGVLRIKGYLFDSLANKYYQESYSCIEFTDGHTYEGYYETACGKKTFSVYCARIAPKDYELNKLILRMIAKYDKKNDYSILKKEIEGDKPVPLKYQ